jgi:hypothetical protein
MRKVIIATAALLFCATPATSQQILQRRQADQEAALAREAAKTEQAEPSLFPTTEQVREDVRSNEARIGEAQAPLGSKDWWYLVAAVAIGVIIAAVVL